MSLAARRRTLDAVVALVLLAGAEASAVSGAGPSSAPLPARVLLSAAAVIPLAWRHRAPVAVWAISGSATVAAIVSHSSPSVAVLATLIALYSLAASSKRRMSAAAGVISLTGLTVVGFAAPRSSVIVDGSTLRAGGPLFLAVVIIACWLIGDNIRVRRAYVSELQAKAERAEADREAELARAAAKERARIARELHDVVAHHVSVIAVQAGAARMLAANAGAAEAGPTWSGVEATARQALSELRQLLGVLRHDGDPPALTPHPGLDQLDQLLDEARRAGLPAETRIEGQPVCLTPSADLCAYRIVQEALTNVMKHQGSAATSVALRYRASQLEIKVASDRAAGPPRPQHEGPGGHGLAGMRERVTLLGGDLDAQPRPDGGFVVTARIPLTETPA